MLLDAVYSADAPSWLAEIPAVETLRQTWLHLILGGKVGVLPKAKARQYYIIERELKLRETKDLPTVSYPEATPDSAFFNFYKSWR